MTNTKQPFVIYVIEDGDSSTLIGFTSKSDALEYAHRFDAFTHEVFVDQIDTSNWPAGKRCFAVHAHYSGNGEPHVVTFALHGPPDKGRDSWRADDRDPIAWSVQTWAVDDEDARRIGSEYLETKREYAENVIEKQWREHANR